MDEREQLEQAIAAQEQLRGTLPDDVIAATVAVLKEKLATLRPEPQRKQVTVLFADVSSFTALSAAMDAEDVTALINALWQRVDRVLTTRGGRIDKHTGDAVMALWGVDQTGEDDPEQAVRAALQLQEEARALAQERAPLQIHIGINTGPVLLGEVGTTGEFTAMGDAVNTAARLEKAAPAGGILISHDTYRHVRGAFAVVEQPPLTVRGKMGPLQTYLVQRALPPALRLRRRGIEGVETRMVGRDGELAQLQAAFEQVLRIPESTLITVVGEAGVGKSRLLYEFDSWLRLQGESFWYLKGRALPQTAGVPYALWRDLFALRFEIQDTDPLEMVRKKMEQGIAHFLPAEPRVKAHFLAELLGYNLGHDPALAPIHESPEQLRNRGLLYLAQLFTAASERHAVVLLLEDLHWADGPSLDALTDLLRRRPNLHLLIVALARSALGERRPDWCAGGPRIALTTLSEADSRELAHEILRKLSEVPQVLVDMLTARAEGNPFYMEELVKMLIEDGVILTRTDPWRVIPEKLVALQVPPTLTGILQARLDRLPPEEREALQQAAVIGRIFWDKAVAHLAGTASAAGQLTRLQSRELVFRRAQTAFAETNEYLFRHALLRDVTYETVLKRTRRTYHLRAAEWLADSSSRQDRAGEYAAQIAEHYELAEQPAAARHWHAQAGEQAAARYSHAEALRHLSRALELTPADDAAARYRLLRARMAVYGLQGNREAHGHDLAALAALAAARQDPAEQSEVALRQAKYAEALGDYRAATAAAQEAIVLARRAGAVDQEAAGQLQGGVVLWRQADHSAAQEHLLQAFALAQTAGRRDLEAESLRNLGIVAWQQADYDQARARCEQSLAICRALLDRHGEGTTLIVLGVIASEQGDYAGARQYLERSLAICRELGDRRNEGAILNNLGDIANKQGDFAGARGCFEQSLAIACQIADRYSESLALNNLGLVTCSLEDYVKAQEHLERSLAVRREIGNRRGEGYTLTNLGEALAGRGRLEEAAAVLREAVALRRQLGNPQLLLESLAGLARVLLAQGQSAPALAPTEEILSYLGSGRSLDGTEYGLRNELTCYQVLRASADPRAPGVLRAAYARLQEQAGRIPDEKTRRSFLENVPWHREIVAAWHHASRDE